MKDDYYKLVHELRLRRARLAAVLQGDTLNPSDVPPGSQEYKDKSYMELYWRLREIQDSMDFTGNENVLHLLTDYRSDGFGELFMQAELGKPIPIPEGLKAKAEDVASSDMKAVRLSGPLKRHCHFFQVVSLMGGGTPHVLYIDGTSNYQQETDPGHAAQAAESR